MKQLRFPSTFYVGTDIIKDFSKYAFCYGNSYVFIGGKRSLAAVQGQLTESIDKVGGTYSFITCGKLATLEEIQRIYDMDCVAAADVVCAVGGGSSMDIARTVANRHKKALIMIPTTVASDAPCSFVSVFYSEDGSCVVGDELYHKCPDMVFVDSCVIANAPAKHLAAGMGDALATFYEATTCKQGKCGIAITETAMALGKLCRDIVLRDGVTAFDSVNAHMVTPQLENVIEANCFLSGVGGANTGCAAAHGIGDYLCTIPGGHGYMHGERVYVGLIVQMILEQYPLDEIKAMIAFGQRVGLPVCLQDMDIENVHETAMSLAKGLQGDHFMINMNCDCSEHVLAGAFVYAGELAM